MRKKKKNNAARVGDILSQLGFKKPKFVPDSKQDLIAMSEDDSNEEKPKAIQSKSRCKKTGPCGKQMFTSESMAKQAIHHRLNKGSNTSSIRCYFCPECKAWHMSSSFKKKLKRDK